jgi:twin arginine-targeting protein translocase tatC
MLKEYFRYAVVIIFIFAAIVTPPDVISQILMAVPLIGLYGISIIVAKKAGKSDEDEDEKQEDVKEQIDADSDDE